MLISSLHSGRAFQYAEVLQCVQLNEGHLGRNATARGHRCPQAGAMSPATGAPGMGSRREELVVASTLIKAALLEAARLPILTAAPRILQGAAAGFMVPLWCSVPPYSGDTSTGAVES
jgi:hypothetical protein